MSAIRRPLRATSRRFDPTSLGYLGLLALPGWVFEPLEPLSVFGAFFLFWFWPLASALITGRGRFVTSSLLLIVNPFVQAQSLAQVAGYVVAMARYRGRPPAPERYEATTELTLPFEGTWAVANGGTTKADSHSWSIIAQRYAYDFFVTDDDGRTHEGRGTSCEDYHCYGEPILAPADGLVVAASDGHRDSSYFGGWLDPFQRDVRGNYVTIRHAKGEYSLLAHLTEGSVAVSAGDRVERGQRIGRCGHSGNSTEPHLHVQLQDRPRHFAAGLPITFVGVSVDPSGDEDAGRDREAISEERRVSSTSAASTNSAEQTRFHPTGHVGDTGATVVDPRTDYTELEASEEAY